MKQKSKFFPPEPAPAQRLPFLYLRLKASPLLAGLMFCAWATAPAADKTDPTAATGDAPPSAPASADPFSAAADYPARHGGATVLIMKEGEIVFERYEAGFDNASAIHMHSGTKGFWGPVIAAMIEDGLVTLFDEAATDTLPEWRDDPRRKNITLRHLLQLNAGLAQDIPALQGHDRSTLAPDLYAHAVTLAAVTEPGRRFVYGPSCYYALGEIMKRKLAPRKQSPLDYLHERILEPIGVEIGDWVHDEAGNPHIPNGGSLTARNWSRFGQFLLQEGKWEDKQIIDRDRMRESLEPSEANPGHGLAIWLNTPGGFSPQTQRSGKPPAAYGPGGLIYPEGDVGDEVGGGGRRELVAAGLVDGDVGVPEVVALRAVVLAAVQREDIAGHDATGRIRDPEALAAAAFDGVSRERAGLVAGFQMIFASRTRLFSSFRASGKAIAVLMTQVSSAFTSTGAKPPVRSRPVSGMSTCLSAGQQCGPGL